MRILANNALQQLRPRLQRFAHLGQVLMLIVDAREAFLPMPYDGFSDLVWHAQRRQSRAHGAPDVVQREVKDVAQDAVEAAFC
jgi:hypothetical protein